jgi:GH24 family phage-related lysozyme (muramidase)
MHASVIEKWHQFSTPLEGRVGHLYADVKQLLTAGVGNLADPVSLALQMPWKLPDGSLASKDEVVRQWNAVKSQAAYLSKRHYKFAAPLSTIRLTDEDIDAFVAKRLAQTERALKKAYPNWDDFPADAQLGCLSMAWAVGDGFPAIFKNFTRFANKQDWVSAKACAKIKADNNPGVVPRNRNNELCFDNAATVFENAMDRSVLHWPTVATRPKADAAPLQRPAITDADRARVLAMSEAYARATAELIRADALRELTGHGIDPADGGGET